MNTVRSLLTVRTSNLTLARTTFSHVFSLKLQQTRYLPGQSPSTRRENSLFFLFIQSLDAMFGLWWIIGLFNSLLSFTLLIFTILLAFDVGGHDCGLVAGLSEKLLILDIFFGSGDVLCLPIIITTCIMTFMAATMSLLSHY